MAGKKHSTTETAIDEAIKRRDHQLPQRARREDRMPSAGVVFPAHRADRAGPGSTVRTWKPWPASWLSGLT
jgi:hypothetical protein